ncbi:putative coilin [Helianthus annuus]|nr:putative coilin [Helianthus annuus]
MGTPSVRVRLVFEDRSILTKTQRSDGMNNTWLLLKLQQHPTIADVCTHLLHIFNLRRSCPNGILLSVTPFSPSYISLS